MNKKFKIICISTLFLTLTILSGCGTQSKPVNTQSTAVTTQPRTSYSAQEAEDLVQSLTKGPNSITLGDPTRPIKYTQDQAKKIIDDAKFNGMVSDFKYLDCVIPAQIVSRAVASDSPNEIKYAKEIYQNFGTDKTYIFGLGGTNYYVDASDGKLFDPQNGELRQLDGSMVQTVDPEIQKSQDELTKIMDLDDKIDNEHKQISMNDLLTQQKQILGGDPLPHGRRSVVGAVQYILYGITSGDESYFNDVSLTKVPKDTEGPEGYGSLGSYIGKFPKESYSHFIIDPINPATNTVKVYTDNYGIHFYIHFKHYDKYYYDHISTGEFN